MFKPVNKFSIASNIFFGGLIMILLGCGPSSIDKEKQEPDRTSKVSINKNDSTKEEYADIKEIVTSNDTVFIDADYIQYLTGQQQLMQLKKIEMPIQPGKWVKFM
jgi:hypothetical protein